VSKLIITGSGRSGTAFIRNVLTDFDLRIGHERIFSIWGMTGWGQFDGDSSWCLPAYANTIEEDYVIYHVVRNPVKVLRSHLSALGESGIGIWGKNNAIAMKPEHGSYLAFWKQHCPFAFEKDTGDAEKDQITRCIRYLYDWDNQIRAISGKTCFFATNKLEDLDYSTMQAALGEIGKEFSLGEIEEKFTSSANRNDREKHFDWIDWDFIQDHPEGHLMEELRERYEYSYAL